MCQRGSAHVNSKCVLSIFREMSGLAVSDFLENKANVHVGTEANSKQQPCAGLGQVA